MRAHMPRAGVWLRATALLALTKPMVLWPCCLGQTEVRMRVRLAGRKEGLGVKFSL